MQPANTIKITRDADGRVVSVLLPVRDHEVLAPLITWASRRTRYTYLAEAAVFTTTLAVSSIVDSTWLTVAWYLLTAPVLFWSSEVASREFVVERWADQIAKTKGVW